MKNIIFSILFIAINTYVFASAWECEWEDNANDKYAYLYDSNELNTATAGETGPVKLVLLSLIRVYQVLTPAQPQGGCRFYPSCSRFGYHSILTYGSIKGTLMAADRISRCNGHVYEQGYAYDYAKGRFWDAPEDNDLLNGFFNLINF